MPAPHKKTFISRNPHCTGAGLEDERYGNDNATVLLRRNPHCTGAGLEVYAIDMSSEQLEESQSSLYWSRVGSLAIMFAFTAELGSQSSLYWSRVGRRPKPRAKPRANNKSQSSLYWSRVGRVRRQGLYLSDPVAILIVLEQGWKPPVNVTFTVSETGRNPHCTGAGLEGYVGKDVTYQVQSRNPHCTGAGLEGVRNSLPVLIAG